MQLFGTVIQTRNNGKNTKISYKLDLQQKEKTISLMLYSEIRLNRGCQKYSQIKITSYTDCTCIFFTC